MKKWKSKYISIIVFVWAAVALGGFWLLISYSNTPGKPATVTKDTVWSIDSKIQRAADKYSLFLFVHPHCSCSRASLGELARLIPHIKEKVKSFVVFVLPEGKSKEWAEGELWTEAKELPETEVLLDESGKEASLFGAYTSGQTYLFNPAGKLMFAGGITPSRSHMGDSDGRSSILSIIESDSTHQSLTNVFGCALKKAENRHLAGSSQ